MQNVLNQRLFCIKKIAIHEFCSVILYTFIPIFGKSQ